MVRREGLISVNAMTGAETLDLSERADQIWDQGEIDAFCANASLQVGRALRLACLTGLAAQILWR